MARRKNKKSKRRLAIFGTISLIAIAYFIFNTCYYSYKIAVLEKSKKQLNEQLTQLQKQEKDLTNDIQKLKDPEYIAKFARENYMYSADKEYVIKIENDKKEEEKIEKETIDYKFLLSIGTVGLLIIILYIIKRKKQ